MQTGILSIFLLVIVIAALVIFYFKPRGFSNADKNISDLQFQLNQLNNELLLKNREIEYILKEKNQIIFELDEHKLSYTNLRQKEQELYNEKINLVNNCASLKSENENLKKAYGSLENLLEKLKTDINLEFINLKQQALLELQNKANDSLMNIGKNSVVEPLNQRLRELNEKIIELKKETQDVSSKSAGLSEQAHKLAQALVRDSQKKGEFGEMILANILEYAGLKDKISYLEQTHISTSNLSSKNVRPDCIIRLPDERGIIIDSKNIVGEYYTSVSNGIDRVKAINDAINVTIKTLADKPYVDEVAKSTGWNIFDYMVMFIPNEGLFNLLVEQDSKNDERGLIWYAYTRKIIIAGPSTILPLLAMIERMWQNHEVEEKTLQILKVASDLSDQLRITMERLTILGNSINKAAGNYDEVIKSFANGSASSAMGKLTQLANYKRDIPLNQPSLSNEAAKRFPQE